MKHRKFKKISFNNKKKIFILEYTTGLKIECTYSSLSIEGNVLEAAPDKEVGNHSFYFITEKLRSNNRFQRSLQQFLHPLGRTQKGICRPSQIQIRKHN